MQAFARVSLQKSFFCRKMEPIWASFLVNPLLASSESLCLEIPSLRLSQHCSAETTDKPALAGGRSCKLFPSQAALLLELCSLVFHDMYFISCFILLKTGD